MSTAVFDFWNASNKDHTLHTGDAWPGESRQNVQFYAFSEHVQGTEAVYDFFNAVNKDHTFHTGEAWPGEEKGHLQFYAFTEQKPGTQPVLNFWNSGDTEHTFHFGAPWPSEEKGHTQFYAYPDNLSWYPSANCDSLPAEDRAKWLVENKGISQEAARQQVMSEFPSAFSHGGGCSKDGHSVDGTFPHTLELVKDGHGRHRLRIAVTPKNPDEVSLIAVHYGINHPGESMNFDIRHATEGKYVHVTPDFGPVCEPGSNVVYWLAGVVKGLIQEMPHGACPNPEARLTWTAQ